MSPDPSPLLDAYRVLGHPVRWAIVRRLAGHAELPWGSLSEGLPVAESTASHHTKVLVRAGLLEARREGRNVHYSLQPAVVRAVIEALASAALHPAGTAGWSAPHAAGPPPAALLTW